MFAYTEHLFECLRASWTGLAPDEPRRWKARNGCQLHQWLQMPPFSLPTITRNRQAATQRASPPIACQGINVLFYRSQYDSYSPSPKQQLVASGVRGARFCGLNNVAPGTWSAPVMGNGEIVSLIVNVLVIRTNFTKAIYLVDIFNAYCCINKAGLRLMTSAMHS